MKIVKSALTLLLIFLLVDTSESQSREDVIALFNEGFTLYNEDRDYLAAIEIFEKTIELAEQVGTEADDIRERAAGQIPRLAFMHAAQLTRERKLEEATDAFQVTIDYAEKYNDDQTLSTVRGNLPILYLNLGNQYYRDQQNQEALEQYRKSLELNPAYVSAYYQKGLTYRRMGDLDTALEHFDTSIDLAREAGDPENVERSQRAARDYLVFRASEFIEEENYNRALDILNRAAEYGESLSLHYRFAEAYNYLERHSNALESAQRALELENGGQSDLARIYFELGQAYKGLDNVSAACDAFGNALFGDFRSPAEHEIEHELNCN